MIKNHTFTKIFVFVIIILLLFSLIGSFAFADKNNDLQEKVLSGEVTLLFEQFDSIVINDKVILPVSKESIEHRLKISVNGCDRTSNGVFLNNELIGYLKEGNNVFDVKHSYLKHDTNEIKILPSSGTTPFMGGAIYGKYNLDDMVIESAIFENAFNDYAPVKLESMNKYMPVLSKSDITVINTNVAFPIAIGDGWDPSTNLGGTTRNTPLFVSFLFENEERDIASFVIDTTEFDDGNYKVSFIKDNETISFADYVIDNTAPVISVSFNNGETLYKNNEINIEVNENFLNSFEVKLDNVNVSSADHNANLSLKGLKTGLHNVYAKAVDTAGNVSEINYYFNLEDAPLRYTMSKSDKAVSLSIPKSSTAVIYAAELQEKINMFYNRVGEFGNDIHLRSDMEVLTSFVNKHELTTESVGNSLPYHSFLIDLEESAGEVIVSYTGEVANGGDICISAYNHNEKTWQLIGYAQSNVPTSIITDATDFSVDGKMRIKAYPRVISNGSDTLLWHTDTQYYARFEDLNDKYLDIVNYAKAEYLEGNIGYVVHTGDLIDQAHMGDAIAHKEFKFASDMQAILDNAFVPNGVVSGNHDIKHSTSDYSYYFQYFGENRYKNFDWYGGSLENNTHHYDIITLGIYDFIFVYLGNYEEDKPETIAWANSVLKSYPNHNAVICTHEYLLPSGAYSGDRAINIWEKIIVPNQNVKMILCGHNDGVADQLKKVEGTDRYVLEILSDYQFAELGIEPKHMENNMTLDGEGFVRLMTFNQTGQVITTTYSPTHDLYNYYPAFYDSFVYDIDLIPANRFIKTTEFLVGTNIRELGEFGGKQVTLKNVDSVFAIIKGENQELITDLLPLKFNPQTYATSPDEKDYTLNIEPYTQASLSGVMPTLRRLETNTLPPSTLTEIGLDLMPKSNSDIRRSSGSTNFVPEVSDGKYKLVFESQPQATWVTTVHNINKSLNLDEYNRLYFGVTSGKNTKWNLVINFGDGTELNFSQKLFESFGYKDYNKPSDIQGTWQGYLPLNKLITGNKAINSAYFVAATTGEQITFDYLFIGKGKGNTFNFIIDDASSVSVDYLPGESVNPISSPFKNGYSFVGWSTKPESDEVIDFPFKSEGKDTSFYAVFKSKQDLTDTVLKPKYSNQELDILSESQSNTLYIILILISVVIAFFIATLIIKNTKKNKQ